jgi:hypothetical protein
LVSNIPPATKGPSAIFFVAILAVASAASLLIVVSPYVFVSHDPGALSFRASLNSTSVMLNQTVKVTVSESSSLRLPDELPLSGQWVVQNMSMGPCSFGNVYPFGVAVFQGRYALGNVSSAKTMPMYAPGGYMCGVATSADSITLKPQQVVSTYADLEGYWTEGYTPHPGGGVSEGVLHPFAPGNYTVVAGDEWGHAEFLYFQVGKIGLSLKNIVLCPSVCGYPVPNLSGIVYFEAPSTLRSLDVFINGTDQGLVAYNNASLGSINLNTQYEDNLPPPHPPVIAHDAYLIRFVLVFEDNSTVTAAKTLIGG